MYDFTAPPKERSIYSVIHQWTKENDVLLHQLRVQGLSFTGIGIVMGMTKGQVIGRYHRIFGDVSTYHRWRPKYRHIPSHERQNAAGDLQRKVVPTSTPQGV